MKPMKSNTTMVLLWLILGRVVENDKYALLCFVMAGLSLALFLWNVISESIAKVQAARRDIDAEILESMRWRKLDEKNLGKEWP